MKAIVVGAGIGAVAIALRRAGVEDVVFEKADELREIGADISLRTNGYSPGMRQTTPGSG